MIGGMDKNNQTIYRQKERWQLISIKREQVKELAEKCQISLTLARILLARNIGNGDIDQIYSFLNPEEDILRDYQYLSDPDQLSLALNRIQSAYNSREKVLINGDPDADGISGTSILVAGLRHLGMNVEFDFPVRSREGHGLQPRVVQESSQNNVKLIITTDCGSKDLEMISFAQSKGIDVIVTDHHILGKELPHSVAVINPHLVKKKTNCKHLSGVGVAHKFIVAIFNHLQEPLPEWLEEFMYIMTTFGTLSDRMNMRDGFNRLVVEKGVKALHHTKREGLKALKKVCWSQKYPIPARELTRSIIPRLNAPGRIGDPINNIPDSNIVVDLLLIGIGKKNAKKAASIASVFEEVSSIQEKMKQGMKEAIVVAEDVDTVNEQRKFITSKIEEEIESLLEDQVDIKNDKVIIVQGKNWNPGVIGIDTDRLKERFLRPSIILSAYDNSPYLRGSVRSIPRIDMYRILDKAEDQYKNEFGESLFCIEVKSGDQTRKVNAFGGHAQACGFTLNKDKFEWFKRTIHQEMAQLDETQFEYAYDIIDKISFSQLNADYLDELETLSPFGQEFEFPIYYLPRCSVSQGKPFGNKYQELVKPHVRFLVKEFDAKGKLSLNQFKAVGFGLWEKYCLAKANNDPQTAFDLIFTLGKSMSRNKKSFELSLTVLDIRKSGKNVDSFLNPVDP